MDNKLKIQKKTKDNKKQNINVVFIISSIPLTEAMEKVLNRGLKFAVIPRKLDNTNTG